MECVFSLYYYRISRLGLGLGLGLGERGEQGERGEPINTSEKCSFNKIYVFDMPATSLIKIPQTGAVFKKKSISTSLPQPQKIGSHAEKIMVALQVVRAFSENSNLL